MKIKSFASASVLAAFLASLCCLGPLLLGAAGLGAVLVATFAPMRPYFLGLSGVLLAAGFYFVYRRPKPEQACEGEVCAPENRARRMAKPLLWLASILVVALALFPSYGTKLVRARAATAPASAALVRTAQLTITGMDCPVCAKLIQKKLSETPGVVRADVRYPSGSATVAYHPAEIMPSQIVDAVNATGYKAALSN